MNYRKFDRHVLYTSEMMSAHSKLIKDVELYHLQNDIQFFNPFLNNLYGIWDGYLYSQILLQAMEYPSDIYERVLDLYRTVDEFIESKLMETEEYRNHI